MSDPIEPVLKDDGAEQTERFIEGLSDRIVHKLNLKKEEDSMDPISCGLITSGTDKGSNWLLREKVMDAFCKHVLREAWKHEKPDGTSYKVRIEILRGKRNVPSYPEEAPRYAD